MAMRALLCATAFDKGAADANLSRHVDALARGRAASCDLAVFPEFSLTGPVDATHHPERALALDDEPVERLVAATADVGVGALFGLGERDDENLFITQVHARDGMIRGAQRKRLLGEGEEGFGLGSDDVLFDDGASTFASIICAEAATDRLWDAAARGGAVVVFFCAAPGLYGRRTDEAGWRDGFEWWKSCGLADARRHAARLGLWVALVTQAGSTVDEDFPGLAALISPTGEVVDQLPDWTPGELVVDIP
jgi:predicted amidohydrolase